MIDQGSDESVNAVNIKKFVALCTDVPTTIHTAEATIVQTRHRVPEVPMKNNQILVLQVPTPEPLRVIEPKEEVTKKMHAEKDYAGIWASALRVPDPVRKGDHRRRVPLHGGRAVRDESEPDSEI